MSDEDPLVNDLTVAVENLDLTSVGRLLSTQSLDLGMRLGPDAWTLLHLAVDAEVDDAVQFGRPLTSAMTRLLLDHGVDPRLRDSQSATPSEMAGQRDHPEAAEMLRHRHLELDELDASDL